MPKLIAVSDYIESGLINNVSFDVAIFALTLFSTILIGKTVGKTVIWTGVGSVDKSFLLFGIFKEYVVGVCLFTIFNWFYHIKIGVYQLRMQFHSI